MPGMSDPVAQCSREANPPDHCHMLPRQRMAFMSRAASCASAKSNPVRMSSLYSAGDTRIGGHIRPTGTPRAASASDAASPASEAAIMRTVFTPIDLSLSSSRSSRGRPPVEPEAPQ
eukprot:scaffold26109_cov101-Isochrysis_galbana.AAC.4